MESRREFVGKLQGAGLLPEGDDVDDDTVRRWFRRFKLQHHPDKVGNAEAARGACFRLYHPDCMYWQSVEELEEEKAARLAAAQDGQRENKKRGCGPWRLTKKRRRQQARWDARNCDPSPPPPPRRHRAKKSCSCDHAQVVQGGAHSHRLRTGRILTGAISHTVPCAMLGQMIRTWRRKGMLGVQHGLSLTGIGGQRSWHCPVVQSLQRGLALQEAVMLWDGPSTVWMPLCFWYAATSATSAARASSATRGILLV